MIQTLYQQKIFYLAKILIYKNNIVFLSKKISYSQVYIFVCKKANLNHCAAAPLSIKKNIFIVIKFKEKDIKLYLAAPEPPDVAPVMPWVAGPWTR